MSEEANQGAPEEKREGSRRRRRRSSGGQGGEEKPQAQEQQKKDQGQEKSGSAGRRRRRRRSRNRKKNTGDGGGEQKQGEQKQGEQKQGGSAKKSRGSQRGSRRRSNRKSRGSNRSQRSGGQGRSRRKTPVRKLKTPESKLGGRDPLVDPSEATSSGPLELTAFELFCACYLGITENNNYRKQSLGEVAQRFRISQEELRGALQGYGLDKESVRKSDFDMSLAELDMKVAPSGLDKKELARPLFDDFLLATPSTKEAIEASEKASE